MNTKILDNRAQYSKTRSKNPNLLLISQFNQLPSCSAPLAISTTPAPKGWIHTDITNWPLTWKGWTSSACSVICWSCLQRMNQCKLLAAPGSKWTDDQGVEWDNKNAIILSGMWGSLDALSSPQVNHLVGPAAPGMTLCICLLSSSFSLLYPPPLCSVILWLFFLLYSL